MNQQGFIWKDYMIFVSERFPKKYYALVNQKRVFFGDVRYQQFNDKLGVYKHLNHKDANRRRLYKKRMEKNRHVKESAGWFADNLLW